VEIHFVFADLETEIFPSQGELHEILKRLGDENSRQLFIEHHNKVARIIPRIRSKMSQGELEFIVSICSYAHIPTGDFINAIMRRAYYETMFSGLHSSAELLSASAEELTSAATNHVEQEKFAAEQFLDETFPGYAQSQLLMDRFSEASSTYASNNETRNQSAESIGVMAADMRRFGRLGKGCMTGTTQTFLCRFCRNRLGIITHKKGQRAAPKHCDECRIAYQTEAKRKQRGVLSTPWKSAHPKKRRCQACGKQRLTNAERVCRDCLYDGL
jgi:hypothetical protein